MLTEILFAVVIIVISILSYLERKDLNNRLMAKDLGDLKDNTQKEEPNELGDKEEEDNLFITLEDAREEIEKDLNNG